MTVFTVSNGGITVKADDGDITDVSFLLDLDMRTGTLVDSTEWLKGFGTQYPGGGVDEFGASNSDGAAEGGLRLLVLELDLETANEEVLIFTEGVDKIVAILGCNMPAAVPDKTVAVSFTDTGIDNGDSSAPAATGGALPALNFHAEAAVDNLQISLLVLA